MNIPWAEIRSEIEQALEVIRFEQDGGHDSESRKYAALAHLKVAILLITGTSPDAIVGRKGKNVH